MKRAVLAILTVLTAASAASAQVYQGLHAAFERISRYSQKNNGAFEKGGRWPTELLVFKDVKTGAEIWRLTADAGRSCIHNHINRSPWNCDGSQLFFMSNRNTSGTGASNTGRYLMSGDCSSFRPIRSGNCRHGNWNRKYPQFHYYVTNDALWEVDVTAGDKATKVASLPNPQKRKSIFSYPSETNLMMVLDRTRRGDMSGNIYFVDVSRPVAKRRKVIHYPFNMKIDYPGHKQSMEFGFHDIMFMRSLDDRYEGNFGPFTSVGEPIFFEFPLDGDKSKVKVCYDGKNPHNPYYSHPAWGPPGPDGSPRVAYYGTTSNKGEPSPGLNVRDHDRRKPIATVIKGWVGGHLAWDGNDPDWLYAAISSKRFKPEWDGVIAFCKTDGTDSRKLCYHYSRLAGGSGGYGDHPRPAQSPDATKCLFSSTMFGPSNRDWQMFIVVGRRPYAPGALRQKKGGGVTLQWTPHKISSEIKGYRVYRKEGNSWTEATREPVRGTEFTDRSARSGKSYTYTVTAEEHSGLESDTLGEIISARTGGSGRGRPANLKGWDRDPPSPPMGLQVAKMAKGLVRLSWKPSYSTDIRFYHVYCRSGGRPEAKQSNRIATVRGRLDYIDWGAPDGAAVQYVVTAVDRQGNESEADYVGRPAGTKPKPKRETVASGARTAAGAPTPQADPGAAEELAAELRELIAEKGAAKKPRIYIDFSGRTQRAKLVSADDKGVTVSMSGMEVPLPWKQVSPKRLYGMAAKLTDDHKLLASFCEAAGLEEDARKERAK